MSTDTRPIAADWDAYALSLGPCDSVEGLPRDAFYVTERSVYWLDFSNRRFTRRPLGEDVNRDSRIPDTGTFTAAQVIRPYGGEPRLDVTFWGDHGAMSFMTGPLTDAWGMPGFVAMPDTGDFWD